MRAVMDHYKEYLKVYAIVRSGSSIIDCPGLGRFPEASALAVDAAKNGRPPYPRHIFESNRPELASPVPFRADEPKREAEREGRAGPGVRFALGPVDITFSADFADKSATEQRDELARAIAVILANVG